MLVLAVTGWEWSIKSRADSGIIARSVDAIVHGEDDGVTYSTAPQRGNYPAENILLLGSDSRAGENREPGNSDDSTPDDVAQADTALLAHVSADRSHVTVISIPRDLMIDAPRCRQWNAGTGELLDNIYPTSEGERWHINAAYSVGGPQCTVRAIQGLTGVRIDRVIGIDFAGFKNMVEALGGITVNVCGPVIDAVLNTVVETGGVQTLTGDQALNLVRARRVEGDNASDLARIRRQQIVLSAILQQVTSRGTLLNPTRLDAFLQAFVHNTYTDNVTIDDLVALAESFGTLDPGTVTFYTLPTVPNRWNSNVLDLDEESAEQVFEALRADQRLPGEPPATPTPATPGTPVTAPFDLPSESSATEVTVGATRAAANADDGESTDTEPAGAQSIDAQSTDATAATATAEPTATGGHDESTPERTAAELTAINAGQQMCA